jgi:hypothetical protein
VMERIGMTATRSRISIIRACRKATRCAATCSIAWAGSAGSSVAHPSAEPDGSTPATAGPIVARLSRLERSHR